MPTLQELRETRANVWAQMNELMDRNGGVLAGEDAAAYDRAETELDALGDQIERGERHAALAATLSAVNRDGVVPAQRDGGDIDLPQAAYDRAFLAFLRNGLLDLTPEDREALKAGYRTDVVKNAAGVGTGAAGGYLVPPAFRDKLLEVMKYFGPMLDVAEVIYTDTGATLPWTTNDDTGNMGAILGENTAITEQDLTFGTASLGAYTYTSKLVRVSWQMMQDVPTFDGFLARKLGERLGRVYNNHATVGTGSAQPLGLVTGGTVGATGTGSLASTGGISYDNLVDVMESIDPAYGNAGDMSWMGHQGIRKALRKLKDTSGRPIWEPSLQAGSPDTLLGAGFRVNNDFPAVAQSSKSLGFGNWREAYVIRVVRENTLVRLNERYADFLQTGFFAFGRMDATVQNTNAYRLFQVTATA